MRDENCHKKFLYVNELKLINHKIMKFALREVENIIVVGGLWWDDYRDFIILFDAVLIKSWKFYESWHKRGWEKSQEKSQEMTRKLCTLPLTQMQTWQEIILAKRNQFERRKNMKPLRRCIGGVWWWIDVYSTFSSSFLLLFAAFSFHYIEQIRIQTMNTKLDWERHARRDKLKDIYLG